MKPAILFVGNFLSAYSASRQLIEEFADRLEDAGWAVIRTSNKAFRPVRLMDMAYTIFVRRNDYEVGYVEIFSGAAFVWAEVACLILRLLKKRYTLTLHGGNLPVFARHWPGRVRRLLNSASAVTAPSGYLQQVMHPYRADILLLPNPVDIKNYPFHLQSTPVPSLVWLRAFHEIYNPSLAPRMLSLLLQDFPSMELKMIGPDKGDGSLQSTQELAENLGLDGNIKFLGGIPKHQVPQYLSSADIFINTTNVDNTPVSVIEAMACGLCVVSTNVGGIPYLLENEKDALLVPPDDPEAMALAVRRILTEPGLAARLSSNARSKVEQFDWSVILPQWEELWSRIEHEK